MALRRVGFVVGTMHVHSVLGRRSGIPRSTPVSLLTIPGNRSIVASKDYAYRVPNAQRRIRTDNNE